MISTCYLRNFISDAEHTDCEYCKKEEARIRLEVEE